MAAILEAGLGKAVEAARGVVRGRVQVSRVVVVEEGIEADGEGCALAGEQRVVAGKEVDGQGVNGAEEVRSVGVRWRGGEVVSQAEAGEGEEWVAEEGETIEGEEQVIQEERFRPSVSNLDVKGLGLGREDAARFEVHGHGLGWAWARKATKVSPEECGQSREESDSEAGDEFGEVEQFGDFVKHGRPPEEKMKGGAFSIALGAAPPPISGR